MVRYKEEKKQRGAVSEEENFQNQKIDLKKFKKEKIK